MGLLVALSIVAGLLWLGVSIKLQITPSPAVLALGLSLCLLLQIVLGFDFWHAKLGPLPLTLDRMALMFLVGVWCLGLIHARGRWMQLDGMDVAVLAWLSWITWSALTHDWTFRDNLPLSRLLFYNLLPVVLYGIIKHSPLQIRDFRLLQGTWLLLAYFLAVTAVMEWQGFHDWIYPRYIVTTSFQEFLGRGRGPLLNPMINGMLMIAGATAGVLSLSRAKGLWKSGLLWSLVVISIGVVSTLTRSVWLSAAAVSGILLLARLPKRYRLSVVVFGVAASALVLPIAKDSLSQFKRDRYVSEAEMAESAKLRPILATVAWEMIQDHPVQGFGFGLYHKFKRPYHYYDRGGLPLQAGLAYTQHNVFLVYLVETGVIGFLLFFGMLTMVLKRSIQLCLDSVRADEPRQMGLFGVCVVAIYVLNGLFHDVSIIPMANGLLLITAGSVGRVAAVSTEAVEPVADRQPAVPGTTAPAWASGACSR